VRAASARSRRLPGLAALSAIAALGAAACGGGDDTASEGEAIVDRVQAACADAPALVVETSGQLEDGTPVRGRQVFLIDDGTIGEGSATITGPFGGGAEIVWDADGTTFFRQIGATCWTEDDPYGAAGHPFFSPDLDEDSPPRRTGGHVVLVGKEPGESPVWEWEIDATTYRLVSQRLARPGDHLPAEAARFRAPRAAPAIPSPTPVC
jgi:hypothetical protein